MVSRMSILKKPRRAFSVAAALTAASLASACANIPEGSTDAANFPGATDTGTFPNLNVPPQKAAPQFNNEEKAAQQAKLASAKGRQGAPATGGQTRSPEELRRLAAAHGQATLDAIEAE